MKQSRGVLTSGLEMGKESMVVCIFNIHDNWLESCLKKE